MRNLSSSDQRIALAGRALAAITSAPAPMRPSPADADRSLARADDALSDEDRRLAGALMRVNHVGEVCAQALYEGQAMSTPSPALREAFLQAAAEEGDHLAWTRDRLRELDARPSALNPLWYGGALAMGVVAGRIGDRVSLGFMAETERQVEAHLDGHLSWLPAADGRSRAIVAGMKDDEVAHAEQAVSLGGMRLPAPARWAMRAMARVMTTVAHRV